MKSGILTCCTALALLAALTLPAAARQQEPNKMQLALRLIDLGTFGGPSSFGDPGHGAGNINNRGRAAGVADTTTSDPYYPNFNPLGFFPDPFVHHAFLSARSGIVDLGALPGVNSSSVGTSYGPISENGMLAGQSLNGGIDPVSGWPEQNVVVWKNGQIVNLGNLGGGYESEAGPVNSHGQVAGFYTNTIPDPYSIVYFLFFGGFANETQTRGFVWDDKNGMQDLGTLGGPDTLAAGVNERGQIIGFSYINDIANLTTGVPTTDPFLWDSGKMIDLGSLGGTFGSSDALNDRGQVVGYSNLAGDTETHAFSWYNGELTDIGTLGGTYSEATNMNEAGDASGYSTTAGDATSHAFIWKRGVITDLGTLPNYDASCFAAFGMNSRDQVVGNAIENSCVGPGVHAFLWQDGTMIDLNDFVPKGSQLTLVDVERINERGEMFGEAVLPDGDNRAFLLIPCAVGSRGCIAAPHAHAGGDAHSAAAATAVPQRGLTRREMVARLRARMMGGHHIAWPESVLSPGGK